jgi:hypothetical protein
MKSGLYTVGTDMASNANVQMMVSSVASNVNVKAIEEHVRGFAESSKVLMNALDNVAKIHPFVAVVRTGRDYIFLSLT